MIFRARFDAGSPWVRAASALTAVAAAALVGSHSSPARADNAISYSEVTRFIVSGPPPQPGTYANGSFDADFQAASSSKLQTGGGIFGFVKTIKSATNMMKNGSATTYYYLDDMERVDDVSNQTGTIDLPDKAQQIQLNFADKTYTIINQNQGMLAMTPPPYQPPTAPQGPQPSPRPGTVKVAMTVSTTSLGSKMLAGENTDGYKTTFRLVASQATGSCSNGTFETSIEEYLSRYPEPHLPSKAPRMNAMPAMPSSEHPEAGQFKPGCVPTFTAKSHMGASIPSGRLVLWQLLSFGAGSGNQTAGMQVLNEAGAVRSLSSSDRSLFQVPAGFTQAAPSPSP